MKLRLRDQPARGCFVIVRERQSLSSLDIGVAATADATPRSF
ncbi:hypothetical protein [Methylobacterium sp. BTF04]|nr:hypothetical protein [Methylobacterium sp. BTF04]